MIGEPVQLLRGHKVDCVYPAEAEIVLEAEILPHVREEEGPFAEFTGYAAAGCASGRSSRSKPCP